MNSLKKLLKAILPMSAVSSLKRLWEKVMLASLRAAVKEQGLSEWLERHERLFPDVSRQYTEHTLDTDILRFKVRAQQSFQVSLAAPVLAAYPGATVVDVGDSSGAHIAALKALLPDGGHRFLSVNIDPLAVEKVRKRGYQAELCRAEELVKRGINADVFLSFEMIEHLSDPATFLHQLSKTSCKRLVVTVPYVEHSRVGLEYVRDRVRKPASPEAVHIFELSPKDFKLLAQHAGWRVEMERIYRQYPLCSPLRATRAAWRANDFEGFYGLVLIRDDAWSALYTGWLS